MRDEQYVVPEFEKQAFHCPHCNAYSQQRWFDVEYLVPYQATCAHCDNFSIWVHKKMVYPSISTAPYPNEDMPQDVREVFEEARIIAHLSPRAAAALLRVALEKLTRHFGETKGSLNARIGNLSKKGLPEQVIKSLDTVRITANEGGAHAGQIDLTGADSERIVNTLFQLVNLVVEKTITEPAVIENMFEDLPEDKKQGIKNRDGNLEDDIPF